MSLKPYNTFNSEKKMFNNVQNNITFNYLEFKLKNNL